MDTLPAKSICRAERIFTQAMRDTWSSKEARAILADRLEHKGLDSCIDDLTDGPPEILSWIQNNRERIGQILTGILGMY